MEIKEDFRPSRIKVNKPVTELIRCVSVCLRKILRINFVIMREVLTFMYLIWKMS